MHFINESLFSVFNQNNDSFSRRRGYTAIERFWLEKFHKAVNELSTEESYCFAFFHNLSKTIPDTDERVIICAEKTFRSMNELH